MPNATAPAVVRLRERALESRDAIELLSNKWRIAILHLLAPGALRAGALQRGLDDVSPKVLTQTLRGMERDGLVERTVSSFGPLRVEYRLSEMGHGVLTPLRELCHWARANTQTRDAARSKFDLQEKAVARRASQPAGR
ncbi:MAG TPA: helix-turn-helix domain-containing protein [Vicinamibacterales bacterium]|jgi:DNA-binding HxlR family transcriptional regulator|nr:helix-turn-helix domain-containing protein [Vicinamibacterales bacterium]